MELNDDLKCLLFRKCFNKVISYNYYGKKGELTTFTLKGLGKLTLDSDHVREFSDIYLTKYATEEEVSKYEERFTEFKECYETHLSIRNNEDALRLIEEGVDIYRVAKIARKYCYFVLRMTDTEIKERVHRTKGEYVTIFSDLLKMKDSDQILDYLNKTCGGNYTMLTNLRTSISTYTIVHCHSLSDEQKNIIEDDLKNKLGLYTDCLKKHNRIVFKQKFDVEREKKDLEILPTARVIIKDIVDTDLSIREYLKNNNLTTGQFNAYLKVLKKYDEDLYNKCKNRDKLKSEQYFNKHCVLLDSLLNDLKNGLLRDNKQKSFDVLDYYLMYGVPLLELKKAIEYENFNVNRNDYLLLRKFISTHMNDNPLDVNTTINTDIEINAKRDDKGFPIKGTGMVITKEERENILLFLNKNNVPLTTATYRIALKRYVDETINNEKNNGKIFKKSIIV